jgi:aryl-alcohol dehydrogenase-like predicted oxidoreductase
MRVFRGSGLERAESLISLVRAIAQRHGRTPSQVALRWLIQQGTVPIPGAKNAAQATENAGALAFALDSGEMDELERISRPWKK